MAMAESRIENPEAVKVEWLGRLDALVSLVKGWVERAGWRTRRATKPVTEPGLGRYDVPLLIMERAGVEVVLSPVARTSPGAGGVVELYLMPAYDDVVSLYFEGGQWYVRYAFPPEPTVPRFMIEAERLALEEGTIRRVLDAASAHA